MIKVELEVFRDSDNTYASNIEVMSSGDSLCLTLVNPSRTIVIEKKALRKLLAAIEAYEETQ